MVTVRNHKRREVNSVLPADPEASSHAKENLPGTPLRFFGSPANAKARRDTFGT